MLDIVLRLCYNMIVERTERRERDGHSHAQIVEIATSSTTLSGNRETVAGSPNAANIVAASVPPANQVEDISGGRTAFILYKSYTLYV